MQEEKFPAACRMVLSAFLLVYAVGVRCWMQDVPKCAHSRDGMYGGYTNPGRLVPHVQPTPPGLSGIAAHAINEDTPFIGNHGSPRGNQTAR